MSEEYRIYEFKKPGFNWREAIEKYLPIIGILLISWILFNGLANVFSRLLATLYMIPIFIVSLVLHEMAHAYMADFLGDPTPRQTGRLSFNPLNHLDLMGSLLFIFCGFGWAKPVQVNERYFKNPNRAMVSVALAGPLCNLLLAILGCLLIKLCNSFQMPKSIMLLSFKYICIPLLQVNVTLTVFNLIPVPPLDGSRLVYYLLPPQYKQTYYALQRHAFLIFGFLFIFASDFITPIVKRLTEVLVTIFA